MDGLLGRPALSVHRGAGHRLGKASRHGGIAGDVHRLFADRHGASHDDVFDQGGIEVVPSEQGHQGLGSEVGCVPPREAATATPDRGSDSVDDYGVGHRLLIVAPNLTGCQIPSAHRASTLAITWRVCQIRSDMSAAMDLSFSPDQEDFRAQARAGLSAHAPVDPLPSLDTAEGFVAHQAWERQLFDDRWSVVSWPSEYGGRDVGIMEWLIFEEEYYRARAPKRVSQNGIFLLAPTMLEYGTDEQKARFLPPMASGEEIWCQGWSEPDAGSDLAGIRSKAVRNGTDDGWLLSGQKTWASRGAFAQWCFGIFRTDPSAERHRGLSYFLIAMDSPGLTVRPIPQIDGETGFAEIFFDNVEVPDSQLLGEQGAGWSVAMSTAGSERGLSLRSPARVHRSGRSTGRTLRTARLTATIRRCHRASAHRR